MYLVYNIIMNLIWTGLKQRKVVDILDTLYINKMSKEIEKTSRMRIYSGGRMGSTTEA